MTSKDIPDTMPFTQKAVSMYEQWYRSKVTWSDWNQIRYTLQYNHLLTQQVLLELLPYLFGDTK